MDNFDSVSLFINENCNQLMSQSALNVGGGFPYRRGSVSICVLSVGKCAG